MAYSKVERSLWHDERFRNWSRDTRELWIYLLTSPHLDRAGGRIGCYVLDPAYAAADLSTTDHRWTPEMIEDGLEELEEHGRVLWDPSARLVLLRNFFAHNRPENPNVTRAAANDVAEIPFSSTVSKGLISAVEEYLPTHFQSGKPCGELLIDAVQSRLDRENQKQRNHGTNNPSETVTPTVTQTVPKGLPQHFRNQEHEQEQYINHPVVAALVSSTPHTREEDSPPAAAPDPVDEEEGDEPDQADHTEHIEAMTELVEETAAEVFNDDDLARRRLIAEHRMIVSGDDLTVWRATGTGDQVPWTDRPRLLRLALQRWELDRDQYPKPRSALLYVIAQQYNPRPQPSMTREEEDKHYAGHRDRAARRGDSTPQRAVVGIQAPPPEPEEETQPAQQWARDHPDEFQAMLKRISEDEDLDLGDTLGRLRATGLAIQKIKEKVLA